ncbi:sulfotransferase family 2 domain-containing protein [Rhodalgimonas zhirmunskyi]|uniref:Sulfotransferase family protein n=1 Tax=Rhodalgimonas zhirmunskyi TaxID=2964767 RepID=A0AAJ1X7E4_9RHOB|nr:sulfotransferase family 2 domain-containing protein [Rhodoalgimonas zhirmunskyi]MDQ2094432.1 sulfotransferase family protein [Rhodoalgimonas zhirmunskyi]
MEISHSKRFLFIHIPKTGGSTLARVLKPAAQTTRRNVLRTTLHALPLRQSPQHAWFEQHDSAAVMIGKLGPEAFGRYTSFAMVRNPFRHAVSHYEFTHKIEFGHMRRHYAKGMGFEEFLEWRLAARDHQRLERRTRFVRMPDQMFYITGPDGQVAVNRILYKERMEDALDWLACSFGLKHPEKLPQLRKQTYPRPVQAYLTPRAVDLIQRLYARDFAAFGYSTDPSADPAPVAAPTPAGASAAPVTLSA